jgi:hypothetical protein
MADIRIEGIGVFQITAESTKGSTWIKQHVQGAYGIHGDIIAFSDDTRMTVDIAEGATADGLIVVVRGRVYLPGGKLGPVA